MSSTQFVGNLQDSPAGQERALEQILEYELLLIQQLNFHLVVHNPYRPLEGFLIDLKVSLKPGSRQSHSKGTPLAEAMSWSICSNGARDHRHFIFKCR